MIFPQNNHCVLLHPNLITAIKMCNFCIGINYIHTHTEKEAFLPAIGKLCGTTYCTVFEKHQKCLF